MRERLIGLRNLGLLTNKKTAAHDKTADLFPTFLSPRGRSVRSYPKLDTAVLAAAIGGRVISGWLFLTAPGRFEF